MDIQQIKQRFGIIGNSDGLNRALEIAAQVAPTDIAVIVTGESGTGKEIIPQVIHSLSHRKHNQYIAVNCGAIPEGTIDSELFGHEKGAFTGATSSRKGYFEVCNGGTIFLDEVAELPLQTQVRLLRVLETGEFIRVGSSKVIKTDVRVVAATNVDMLQAIKDGKFREDLYYRLNTVPIHLPPLRERKEDIYLLFRKFANDFSEKYRMPAVKLKAEAIEYLKNYPWPGNIRQLRNLVEQLSIMSKKRELEVQDLIEFLPPQESLSPAIIPSKKEIDEREIMYKFLFEMKKDLNDLKKVVAQLALKQGTPEIIIPADSSSNLAEKTTISPSVSNVPTVYPPSSGSIIDSPGDKINPNKITQHQEIEEILSLEQTEKELIKRALEKHNGRRKQAAQELGISERTLYRKIKEYNIQK